MVHDDRRCRHIELHGARIDVGLLAERPYAQCELAQRDEVLLRQTGRRVLDGLLVDERSVGASEIDDRTSVVTGQRDQCMTPRNSVTRQHQIAASVPSDRNFCGPKNLRALPTACMGDDDDKPGPLPAGIRSDSSEHMVRIDRPRHPSAIRRRLIRGRARAHFWWWVGRAASSRFHSSS